MDPRIASLKSTTFCGRRLTRRQIADVQETVALSRNELAKTVCEHLNWTTPKGGYRVAACMRMLESLEEYGVLTLPAKRNTTPGPRTPITCTGRSDPRPEINCALAELEPLSLQSATEERDIADWNELVDRHHGLGCPRPFGPHLRWFVMDRDGRCLGCLLFEAAAKSLPARDAWIGWSEKDRDRRLHLAVSNSRFLILPWVRVDRRRAGLRGSARLQGQEARPLARAGADPGRRRPWRRDPQPYPAGAERRQREGRAGAGPRPGCAARLRRQPLLSARRGGARHPSREHQRLGRRAGARCTSRRSTAATARSRASCAASAASPPSTWTAI